VLRQGSPAQLEDQREGRHEGSAGGGAADQIARSIVLVILFSVPALLCVRAAVMSDPDVWWHLRTGQWILEQHAFPQTDPFSIDAMGKPWQAYSWLFDLVILRLFREWDLVGIVVYTSGMVAAITALFYRLVSRLQPDFTKAVLLTAAGVVCLSGILTPRPWMFSIVFFVLELDVLMQARRTGKWRELMWLPALFALWANIHIQFVDGLVVLGVAAIEPVAQRWWPWRESRLRGNAAWATLGGCVAGTLLNPYGWRIYQVAFGLATEGGVANTITELKALEFRDAADFLLAFMALAAAAALTWRRRPGFFEAALLAIGTYLSLHSMRDRWFLAAAACAVLAGALPAGQEAPKRNLPALALPAILAAAWGVMAAGFAAFGVTDATCKWSLAKELPVNAVEALRQQGLGGRLFNDYDWGGYLIWSLRQPVSIDGRAALYGAERIARNVDTWNGKPDWASDPDLAAAGLVVGPTILPLTQILREDPAFRIAYEDKTATVFVRRR